MTALSEIDPTSFSNPAVCEVNHLHLDLSVDFDSKLLIGHVDLTLLKKELIAKKVILDSKGLKIQGVKNKNTQENLNYVVGSPVQSFGSKLEIDLPKTDQEKLTITIKYETSHEAEALQWLSPLQTAGKLLPYMFSQCEPICARTIVPCQDTPSVKAAYSAIIHVPSNMTVLMSGIKEKEEISKDLKTKSFSFVQNVPIPSYLIAIVVGALESRKIGPRTHIWAEKEYLDKAAFEFSETESMLKTAEDLLGPYEWGIYDLLVLPPSFPFGGMENPCLSFLTPTLLAGDKSLVTTVAHEMSHSWTGNLVTNKNFEHFWLNEGFTRFVELKLCGRMSGEPYRQFQAILSWKNLEDEVKIKGDKNPLTKLVVDLKGVNPEDSYSIIPYEKGQVLLYYLEELLGGPEIFEAFLRAYIKKFKHKSIDTDEWKSYLYEFFKDKEDILNKVDWDAWLYSPGMPPIKPDYDTSLQDKCVVLCKAWVDATDGFTQFTKEDVNQMNPFQVVLFLTLLLEEEPISHKKMEKLTEIYDFKNNFNSEIRCKWLCLGLRSHWHPIIPYVTAFLSEIGRLKFVQPLYRDLCKWKEMRSVAVSTYKKHCDEMMSVTVHAVEKILNDAPPV